MDQLYQADEAPEDRRESGFRGRGRGGRGRGGDRGRGGRGGRGGNEFRAPREAPQQRDFGCK